jgi:hypothetical protein
LTKKEENEEEQQDLPPSKFSDFTVETINRLIDDGENDAIKALSAPAS